jgi:hypothetical protein
MIFPPHAGHTRPRVVRFSTSSANGLSLLIRIHPCHQWFRYFRNTTKIEQNIDTGGIKSTSTPILKLRMNRELVTLVNDARHIEHCACAKVFATNTTAIANTNKTKTRRQLDFITAPPTAPARPPVAP